MWEHLPSDVHTDRQTTVDNLLRGVEAWQRVGLGYWTARLRTDLPAAGLGAGAMVGTGGCTVRQGTD